jgi:hypothetical protein
VLCSPLMGSPRTRLPLLGVLALSAWACAPEEAELEAEAQGWPEEVATEGSGRFLIEGQVLELGYRTINGHRTFEGDIVLDDEPEVLGDEASSEGVATEALFAVSSDSDLWPRGVVPYTIHSSVSTPGRVRTALRTWEATGIRFVPRTTQAGYVTFIEDPGHPVCSAQVGYNGRRRYVYLRDTDRYEACSASVLVHEVGHVLGLWHEHTRPDRNTYVTIHWSFVPSAYREAFEIKRSGVRRVGAYDITSSMHYRSTTLTRAGGSSITRRDGTRLLHDWSTLSRGDVAAIRTLYFDGTPVPRPSPPDAGPRDAGIRDAGVGDTGAGDTGGIPDAGPVASDASPYLADATIGAAPLPEEIEAVEETEDGAFGDDLEEDRSLHSGCSAAVGRGPSVGRSLTSVSALVMVLLLARRFAGR